MSESVVVHRINFKPCKDNHLTTWHSRVTKTPWVATVHNDYQSFDLRPPYPSACLPLDTSTRICGWPTRWVSSNTTTIEATKFAGPHKSHMRQYIIELPHRGQAIGPQSTQVGATTFGAPNMTTDLSPTFPFDILHFPLIAPPGLILMPQSDHFL
jgi:hypothetical protein